MTEPDDTMSSRTHEGAEYSNLENFLSDDDVQWVLDRHGLKRSDLQWFVRTHISENRYEKYGEEAVGVVALMYVHGTECKGTRRVITGGNSEHKAVLQQLGYEDSEGPGGWGQLHYELRKSGPFTKGMLEEVHRIQALSDEHLDPATVMAYAQGIDEGNRGERPEYKRWEVICEQHNVSLSKVRTLADEFEDSDE